MKIFIIFISLLVSCFILVIPVHCESNATLSIPYGTTEIDNSLMSLLPNCQNISIVYIPETVTSIDFSVFQHSDFSTVENFCVSQLNPCYQSVDGAILSKDGKRYCMYPRGREAISYVLPQGVVTIGEFAFFETAIDVVVFPDSLDSISDCAFSYSEIVYAHFNYGLTKIGDFAFLGCNSLEGVDFPATLKHIGCEAFSECSIDCVTIPEGTSYIGGGAFAFNRVSVLSLPSTLEYIGNAIIGWNHMENDDFFTTILVPSGTMSDYYASEYLSDYEILRIEQ